jgi:hypothetical protein
MVCVPGDRGYLSGLTPADHLYAAKFEPIAGKMQELVQNGLHFK